MPAGSSRRLEHNDLDPRGFYAYGYLHPTLSYAFLWAFERLGYDASPRG